MEFHPTAQVAAIAGVSGNVSIFQVDGHLNPKIQTVHFDHFPIERAHFSKDGEEIIVVSKCHPHFFYYDMIKGKINKVALDRGNALLHLQGCLEFINERKAHYFIIRYF